MLFSRSNNILLLGMSLLPTVTFSLSQENIFIIYQENIFIYISGKYIIFFSGKYFLKFIKICPNNLFSVKIHLSNTTYFYPFILLLTMINIAK